jgi:hypothetical protein
VRKLFDVTADDLAQICHFIDERNFGGEERIGGVFDEFGGYDVGEN